MNEIRKFGLVSKSDTGGAPVSGAMAKINALTLRELSEDEVFIFRVAAADDQIDRDFERFSEKALSEMAALYVGKTIIADHEWRSRNQAARIFDAAVEKSGDVTRLVLSAYMLRNEDTAGMIAAVEGGILKEVSVGVGGCEAICSICGVDKSKTWCDHRRGAEYEGKLCHVVLNHVTDAYECSFVAVPAQREAGVIKAYGGEENRPQPVSFEVQMALAWLELEEKSL